MFFFLHVQATHSRNIFLYVNTNNTTDPRQETGKYNRHRQTGQP